MKNTSKSDINEILNGVKSGKQEDYEKLRRMYSPLISKEVFSFSMSGAGNEGELKDEAERALLSAAVSFDPEQGVGFGYYAKVCIRNALITVRRSVLSRERKRERLNSVPAKRRQRSFDAFSGLNQDEILTKISTVLSPYEMKVFTMSLEGKSAAEIGAAVGKNEKSVNNAIFRSRAKIRAINK